MELKRDPHSSIATEDSISDAQHKPGHIQPNDVPKSAKESIPLGLIIKGETLVNEGDPPTPPQRRKTKLLDLLVSGREEEFLSTFADFQKRSQKKEIPIGDDLTIKLLVATINSSAHTALDCILGWRFQNQEIKGEQPIEAAFEKRDHLALRKLFAHERIKVTQPEEMLLRAYFYASQEGVVTLRYLLERNLVKLNEAYCHFRSPLHQAVIYRNWEATRLLLQHGAYLGAVTASDEYLIQSIPAKVLNDHFDSCITTNSANLGKEDFEIKINYANLNFKPNYLKTYDGCFCEKLIDNQVHQQVLHHQMCLVEAIAQSPDHRQLTLHPVLTSFMFIKWHFLSGVFYMNLVCYIFFAIFMLCFTVFKFRRDPVGTLVCGTMAWIGIGYVIIRELMQFLILPRKYFRSPSNYLELLLIALAVWTCCHRSYDHAYSRFLDVITNLLVSIELCVLVGTLPFLSISTYMLMLREVTKNFLKGSALYSILIVTFGVCFYILFSRNDPSAGASVHNFNHPLSALGRTIVMMTGEYDASDIKFQNVYGYLVFLIFVVFLSIVLFNLLNGLAVSDTQAIRGEAKLHGYICRTELLCRYEKFFTGQSKSFLAEVIFKCFSRLYCHRRVISHIEIFPNKDNMVFVKVENEEASKDLSSFRGPFRCLSILTGKLWKIDSSIVKSAMAVLDQRCVVNNEDRLENIERILKEILKKM